MAQTIFGETGDTITQAALSALLKLLANNYVVSGYTYDSASGLDVTIAAGEAFVGGFRVVDDAALSAITVADDDESWIFLGKDGTLSTNTTGVTPSDSVPLVRVTAASGSITANADIRPRGEGGMWDLIQTQEVESSVASVEFTGLTDLYEVYVLVISRTLLSANNIYSLRVTNDGGSNWRSGASDYSARSLQLDGTALSRLNQSELQMTVSNSGTAGDPWRAVMFIQSPLDATARTGFHGAWHQSTNGLSFGGKVNTGEANDGIQILPTAGTIEAGVFSLYGIRNR